MKKLLSIIFIIVCFSAFTQKTDAALKAYNDSKFYNSPTTKIRGADLNTMYEYIFESLGIQYFDSTRTYTAGQNAVIYDGSLYRCAVDISAAGAWDAADWTQLTDTIRLWSKVAAGISSYSTIDVICNGGLEMGSVSAPAGAIALANNKGIWFNNVAGPAMVEILSLNGSDVLELYNGKATLDISGDLQADGSIEIGTTNLATAGDIRGENDLTMSARNSTNTANIELVKIKSDEVFISDSDFKINCASADAIFAGDITLADSMTFKSGSDRLYIKHSGNYWKIESNSDSIRIDASVTDATGKFICDSIYTTKAAAWADYVFSDVYYLYPLKDEIQYIKTVKHLRSLEKADNEKQISVSDIQKRLEGVVEETEKLYLYIEQLEKRIKELEK